MKRYRLNFALLSISMLFASLMYSCKEEDDVEIKEPTISENKAEKILDSAVTEWHISLEQVSTQMKNHNLVTTQNDDFLMYSSKDYTTFISYKFYNDSLCSTLVLMPQVGENVDLGNIMKGCSFMGELDNANVYLNAAENTLVCAYEITEDSVTYQAIGFTPINSVLFQTSGIINGHEWADLGLSVKWATCNVGANSSEDYGDYFAWGETSTKSEYTEENSVTYKKYFSDIAGDSRYDAARANWGGSWRLPTKTELEELVEECTWTWTTQGGHNGYKVVGPNGNSIFLPAAGWRGGSSLYFAGESGDYWSSTPYESSTRSAYRLSFGSGYHDVDWSYRLPGRTVRPVSE